MDDLALTPSVWRRSSASGHSREVTFIRLAFFEDASAEQYEAVARELADAPVPPERRFFAAGPVDGGWQVVQAWDTKDALDEFNTEWFLPALARLGDDGLGRPTVRDVEAVDAWVDRTKIR